MRLISFSILILAVLLTGCLGGDHDPIDPYRVHKDITVTVFWIGEPGSEENGFIPNIQSAWDDRWMEHYGGVDDPIRRNGSLPSNFTPLENTFYFALPYNDFDADGDRRSNAYDIVPWSDEEIWSLSDSMCKNRWIMISKEEKVAYAQWEDVGPFREDDAPYVFGGSSPKNDINEDTGLDVSPAVRDLLDLNDIDRVDWKFVDPDDVPDGPWKEIVTDSQIDWD